MRVVVSDTSPLRALGYLRRMDLLQSLYGEVLLPPAVQWELQNPPRTLPAFDAAAFPFLRVQSPQDANRVQVFLRDLDLGEAEALALALEVSAELIVIDERDGSGTAVRLRIK